MGKGKVLFLIGILTVLSSTIGITAILGNQSAGPCASSVASIPSIRITTRNPDFSSSEVADYVASLSKASYAGNVNWSGEYVYTEDPYLFGFASWKLKPDCSGAIIELIGIPANLPLEVEKAFWDKELTGTLYALEWFGQTLPELPETSTEQTYILLDGLALLKQPEAVQRILQAEYPKDSRFGKYIVWNGGLTCEQLVAIELLSTVYHNINPGGVDEYISHFNCS
jgi:hypothetical protein